MPIRVSKRHGGATRIEVIEWPEPQGEWSVCTIDPPHGRNLQVVGPTN